MTGCVFEERPLVEDAASCPGIRRKRQSPVERRHGGGVFALSGKDGCEIGFKFRIVRAVAPGRAIHRLRIAIFMRHLTDERLIETRGVARQGSQGCVEFALRAGIVILGEGGEPSFEPRARFAWRAAHAIVVGGRFAEGRVEEVCGGIGECRKREWRSDEQRSPQRACGSSKGEQSVARLAALLLCSL